MPADTACILVVDDEPNICRICTRVLEKMNYEVRHAFNGYDALKMIAAQPFDVIITDLKMSSLGLWN